MAGQLSIKGEELALNAIFRDDTKPVYLGLATSTISDSTLLSTVAEVSDTAYTRKQVTFSAPVQDNSKTTIKNSIAIDFAPWNANQATLITYAFLTYASSGTAGDIITWFLLEGTNQIQPVQAQPVRVPANSLVIQLD